MKNSLKTLNKLVDHCFCSGIEVEILTHGNIEYLFRKEKKKILHELIRFNETLPKTTLVYGLLHELGHRKLIHQNFEKNILFGKEFMVLFEELMAWKEGLEIAKELKISINKTGYRNYATKALRTYIGGLFLTKKQIVLIESAMAKFV